MPLGWGSSNYPHTPGISRWYPVGIRLGRGGRFVSLRSLNDRRRGGSEGRRDVGLGEVVALEQQRCAQAARERIRVAVAHVQ